MIPRTEKKPFINQTADATKTFVIIQSSKSCQRTQKENVYFYFFWLGLPQRKQKESKKRAGGGG
jgi:hypothetical protein